MRPILACFLLCAGLVSFTAGPRPATPPTVNFHTAARHYPAPNAAEILRLVNQHRRAIGRPPLQANSYMSSVALGHSQDMLSGRSPFGHDGFRDRIDHIRKKLGPMHVAAENVASGPMSAREVVDGWLHSPGHRRNIEGDFRLTGIGLAFGRNGNIFFTQIFAR